MEIVEVEDGAEEDDEREEDDGTTDDSVDDEDAALVEDVAHLVDQPCESKPPDEGTGHNAEVADEHLERMVGDDEGKLGEKTHEKEDDEGVGEGDQEGGHAIVHECAFVGAALVHVLRGVGAPADDAEGEQHDAARELQPELVLLVVDDVHDEAHACSGDEGVDDVADGCPDAGDEAIPPSLVQGALHTKDAHRPHGSGGNHADEDALEHEIDNVYMEW